MAKITIKTATASDRAPVIDVVVLAFSADPAARWTWPNPQQYLRHFPSFVEAIGGKAFAHGSAYYADGYTGAALWLPPDVHPDEDALATLLQRTGAEEIRNTAFALFEQMGRYHPSEPHWYLPLIAVDPWQRGKRSQRPVPKGRLNPAGQRRPNSYGLRITDHGLRLWYAKSINSHRRFDIGAIKCTYTHYAETEGARSGQVR